MITCSVRTSFLVIRLCLKWRLYNPNYVFNHSINIIPGYKCISQENIDLYKL